MTSGSSAPIFVHSPSCVRSAALGETSAKPFNAEQVEIARLKAELARVKMERDILKNAAAYFAKESL